MSVRTALWLMVLASGIALWGYLLAGGAPTTVTPVLAGESTRVDRLLPWPLERLTAVDFSGTAGSRRIERVGVTWRYAQVSADSSAKLASDDVSAFIEQHLNMFGAARIERSFAVAPVRLADYGIINTGESIQLTIDGQVKPACTLRPGKRTPDSFGQYVLVEPEQRVVIVPAYHLDNLAALAAGPRPAP